MKQAASKGFVGVLLLTFVVSWTTFLYLPTSAIMRLAIEDGPVEYASAFSWAISCGLIGVLFVQRRNVWHLLLAIVFFLCLGEEISWGQRLIGFATPEFLVERNLQGEFNLHNLDLFDRRGSARSGTWQNFFSLGRMFSLFWFSYYCALPYAARASAQIRDFAIQIRLPILPLFFAPFLIGNYAIFKYYEVLHAGLCAALGLEDRASMSNLLGETRELYESLAFLSIVVWQSCVDSRFNLPGPPAHPHPDSPSSTAPTSSRA